MLKGKTAVITGGNRGIGKEITKLFVENGCNTAIICRSNTPENESLLKELLSLNIKAKIYNCDISDFDETAKIVKEINIEFGGIDILINNAGITKDNLLIRMSEENFDDVIDINLKGAFNMIRHVSPLMWRKKHGRIINITSITGVYGSPGQANYCASKAGMIGLTKSASKELGIKNITVNAIAPGYIETDMTKDLSEEYRAKIMERLSVKRLGKASDIANVALFLANDNADYITGQIIGVDGGLTI